MAIQSQGKTFPARPGDIKAVDYQRDLSSLSLHDLKALMNQLSGMMGTLEHLRVESVLASLNYDTREVRHDSIKEAHAKTFEWAFDSNFTFSKWLQSGDGIFWVSGKPGSGKSTLMRFLADHTQTKALLKEWAGDNDVVVASHYFWSSGTLVQKSWDGLLRSLLFDIFRSYPQSIQGACPERLEKAGWPGTASMPWTIIELAKALRAAAKLNDSSCLRFCFFIDGLDEYDGDHLEICGVFNDLVRGGNVKICLSSRPWPVFEDSLGQDLSRKLYVQDLSYNDIRAYVTEQLESHPKWKTNSLDEKERSHMVEAIAEKADGVFLWAYLVTRSLREGLSDYDTGVGLKKRLDELPGDLEKLFRRLLESVDPIYQRRMACFLQAAAVNTPVTHPDDAGIYCNMEKELDEPGYALRSSFCRNAEDEFDVWHRDDEQSTNCNVLPELRTHLLRRYSEMRDTINSRTKGILETTTPKFPRPPGVKFFHRTMYDFIQSKEMEQFIGSKLNNDFNIHICFMKGYLIRIKRHPLACYSQWLRLLEFPPVLAVELSRMLGHALDALATIEKERFGVVFTLLDEFERVLHDLGSQSLASRPSCKMLGVQSAGCMRAYTNLVSYFRELVILHGCRSILGDYIEFKMKETPGYVKAVDTNLLLRLISLTFWSRSAALPIKRTSRNPHHNMLELLLCTGTNVNQPFRDGISPRHYGELSRPTCTPFLPELIISPWVLFMRGLVHIHGFIPCDCYQDLALSLPSTSFPIIELFLNYGADPDAEFLGRVEESNGVLRCNYHASLCLGSEILPFFYVSYPLSFEDEGHKKRFLSHPTFSKPPLFSMSCFFAYIWYPFQVAFSEGLHTGYLATLDVFLSKRPSLDPSNAISDVITSLEVKSASKEESQTDEDGLESLAEGWILVNDKPSDSPFVQFCAHICYKNTWTEGADLNQFQSAKNQFRSAIIEKLIGYCGAIKAHDKFFTLLEFGISKAEPCPEDIKRRLLDLVEEHRGYNGRVGGSQSRSGSQERKEVHERSEVGQIPLSGAQDMSDDDASGRSEV